MSLLKKEDMVELSLQQNGTVCFFRSHNGTVCDIISAAGLDSGLLAPSRVEI
jgi:hypothetical protein